MNGLIVVVVEKWLLLKCPLFGHSTYILCQGHTYACTQIQYEHTNMHWTEVEEHATTWGGRNKNWATWDFNDVRKSTLPRRPAWNVIYKISPPS